MLPGVNLLSRRRLSGFPVLLAIGLGPGFIPIIFSFLNLTYYFFSNYDANVYKNSVNSKFFEIKIRFLRNFPQFSDKIITKLMYMYIV